MNMSVKKNQYFVHRSALIAKSAKVGKDTKIWAYVQIGENAKIGKNCVIGNGVYIDRDVAVGNNVKIHNKALLYRRLIVEDNCFIGPGACFTNDKYPRAGLTRNLKNTSWRMKEGAVVGANATILPDITIGKNAVVGAGSVVVKDVPDNAIVCGNPAKVIKRKNARDKN